MSWIAAIKFNGLNMNTRKLAYSLAVIMLSYDVLSTLIVSKRCGWFAELSPLYNFLYQGNPVYIPITIVILISGLVFIFWVALLYVNNTELSVRILITLCDFAAVYLLIFEAIAVPHNTMVLFGSYGIILSSKMFIIQEIASALIAGVIVVMVDWRRVKKAA